MLIGFANGINYERYFCQVIAKEESGAGLKRFLFNTEKRYDGLYDRTTPLLEKEYFGDPHN
ncbi:MAG: hypothetical protein IPM37_14025 [Hahellaceae bacterium]|nr:hypothetical protein [Hahellaceae bacterium]